MSIRSSIDAVEEELRAAGVAYRKVTRKHVKVWIQAEGKEHVSVPRTGEVITGLSKTAERG